MVYIVKVVGRRVHVRIWGGLIMILLESYVLLRMPD